MWSKVADARTERSLARESRPGAGESVLPADQQSSRPTYELTRRRVANVFVAHKSRLLMDGLSEILAKEGDIRVTGTASEPAVIRKSATRLRDSVVLLDATLAADDPTLLPALSAASGVRIVLLMESADDRQVLRALQLGVRGVLLESMGARLLVTCIRKVHAGEEWIEQDSARRLLHRMALQDSSEYAKLLSHRELEVIRGIARGLTNREIASELFINAATVKTHVHNVFRKLAVSNRVSVCNWARTHGLI